MKKLLQIIILSLLIFNNVSAEKRDIELQNLFKETVNIAVPNSYFEKIKSWIKRITGF